MSYSELEHQVTELEYELDEQLVRNNDLESELANLKYELDELRKEKEELEDENEDLTVKVQAMEVQNDQLLEDFETMEKEYEKAKEKEEQYEELIDKTVFHIERDDVQGYLGEILSVRSDFVPVDLVNMATEILSSYDITVFLVDALETSLVYSGVDISKITPTYVLEITEDEKLIIHKDDKFTWSTNRVILHESYFDKIWKYKDEMKIIGKNKLAFSREILSNL